MAIQEPESPRDEAHLADLKAMGRLITSLREERGMSREELAPKCEMTVPELQAIESGEREERWGRYRKLAEALGTDWPTLFEDLGTPHAGSASEE